MLVGIKSSLDFERSGSPLLVRLRPTLLAVILGLLSGTVLGVGSIAFLKTSESIDTLATQQFAAVAQPTKERVLKLVFDAPRILL